MQGQFFRAGDPFAGEDSHLNAEARSFGDRAESRDMRPALIAAICFADGNHPRAVYKIIDLHTTG
jgi:hypothetical protein